jgi:hypothetical protein
MVNEARGQNKQASDCYRKVIEFVPQHHAQTPTTLDVKITPSFAAASSRKRFARESIVGARDQRVGGSFTGTRSGSARSLRKPGAAYNVHDCSLVYPGAAASGDVRRVVHEESP